MNNPLNVRNKRWNDTQLLYSSEFCAYSKYTNAVIRKGHKCVVSLCEKIARERNRSLTILDVGCGWTDFYEKLNHVFSTYIGIEPSSSELLRAKSRSNQYLMRGVGEKIFLPDSCVDIALLISVLDHCFDANKTIEETFRVLRPGGTVVILLENRGRLSNDIRKFFKMNIEHGEHHLHYFSVDDILRLTQPFGTVSYLNSHGFLLGFNWISKYLPENLILFLEEISDSLFNPFFTKKGQHFLLSLTKKNHGESLPLSFLCPHCGKAFSWNSPYCGTCKEQLTWIRDDILETMNECTKGEVA